ncbi:reverse transcriptase [Tanacetum coccineum]
MNYHGNPLLSSIWKFKVPPKARLLCWQVLSSKLPTRDLLSRIGVISENHIECSLCCSGDVSKDQRPSQWCLPDDVNVDGLAKGKPGLAYIGGLLRNTEGVVVALFSVPVGVMDSNVVKVLAMKDACKMLNKKVELNSVKVVIESDYLNAVSWAHTPIMRPWRFLPYFYEHLEEKHVTWAHLEKKQTRLRLYTKSLEEIVIQTMETASPTLATASELDQDGVRNLTTASECSRLK